MSKWIRKFRPAPEAAARLICFPHAGGSASAYIPVAGVFQDRIEVLSVQYPGRQDRFVEPCAADLDELIDGILGALAPVVDDHRPFGFFGHSMGALVAFETARRLERAGKPPAALFVSARPAPSLPFPASADDLLGVDDAVLLAEVTALGGVEKDALSNPELQEFILPALRADYRLLATYRYRAGPALSCPLVALVGDADPSVSVDSVRKWEQETLGGFELHTLPGGHFYLDGQLPDVARIVSAPMLGQAPQQPHSAPSHDPHTLDAFPTCPRRRKHHE
ncbi:thioesterase II family protein [Streptomyces albidoflavus]